MLDIEKVKLVQEFIFNDKVQNILSKINDNVMDFNILEITGMGSQEIKHSNVLGWLFDDSEHNLEYQILDNFLKKIIEKNYSMNKKDILQSYLYLSNKKRDITIYREKDNIDLLIVDETNKIVITIENKVYAKESETQLSDYTSVINKKYPDFNGYKKYFIFLTIDLEKPSSGNEFWLKAKHQYITDVIEDILKTKETTDKTKIILESYVDLLKRNGIVKDGELKELCEKIWDNKDYLKALDILNDYKVTPLNKIYNSVKNTLKLSKNDYDIELDSILKLYNFINKDWKNEKQIFEIQIVYYSGKNEHIWLGFYYPDLINQNENIQNMCKKILNKNNKEYETILELYRKDIDNIESSIMIKKIIDKINDIDRSILNIIKNEVK